MTCTTFLSNSYSLCRNKIDLHHLNQLHCISIPVQVEYYPSWGDIIEVDTWVGASGKNGMRRGWHVRDRQTGQTIMRATSNWVMMNKQTRRLSKFPEEEVRAEFGPYFLKKDPVIEEDSRNLPKLRGDNADHVRSDLTPRWSDLDVNQHANNVKYIGWILEGTPRSVLENHELGSMTLEYMRECGRDSVLQLLAYVSTSETSLECQHLLQLESGGAEFVKGCT